MKYAVTSHLSLDRSIAALGESGAAQEKYSLQIAGTSTISTSQIVFLCSRQQYRDENSDGCALKLSLGTDSGKR